MDRVVQGVPRLVLIGALAMIMLLLLQKHEASAAPPSEAYVLVPELSDEFDGAALDTDKWLYRKDTRFFGRNVPENVSVTTDPDEPSVQALRLAFDKAADPAENNGVPYTSSGVITKSLLGYGYYEIRAKLWAEGHGLHQSFWNMGLNFASDHEHYLPFMNMINEIDMFEVDSDNPTRLIATSHYHNTPNGRHVKPEGSESIVTIDDPTAGYRVYGFEWLPDRVIWYVDGEVIKTYPYQGPHAMQNLWLTALQLSHDALEVDDSVLPGYMYVDYFRYYVKEQPELVQAHLKAVIYDNEDPAYTETGLWDSTNVPFGYQDRSTRQSNEPGAEARWTTAVDAGSYEVFIWNPSYFDSTDAAAQVTVQHNGTASTRTLNQQTAGQNWISLGVYDFAGTAGEYVSIAKVSGDASYIRADSVMLIPIAALASEQDTTVYDESAGSWNTSTTVRGWDQSTTRYATGAAPRASWEPVLPGPGAYDIYAWLPVHAGNASKFKYTVHADGQPADRIVSGREGESRWVHLGTHEFSGTHAWIELSRAQHDGALRTDAIKLYPSEPLDPLPPAAPSGLSYQAGTEPVTGNYSVELQWEAHTEADVQGYNIYMNGFRINQTLVTRNRTVLDRLLPQHSFTVDVRAVDHAGSESAPAVITVTTGSDAAPPATPATAITLTQGRSGTLLAEIGTLGEYWRVANTEYDFRGYYYYVDGVRHNTQPAGRSYALTGLVNGQTYEITVTAVDLEGNESPPSAPVYAAPLEQHIAAYATNMSGYSRAGSWIKWWQRGEFGRVTVTQQYGPSTYFEWSPGEGIEAKTYEVWVWNARHLEGTTAARYTIGNGTDSATVLRSQYGKTTDSAWEYLGSHAFSGTAADYIRVEKDAADPSLSTYLLANGVKLIPVDTLLVADGHPGYTETGVWQSSSLTGHAGTGTRYAGPGPAGSSAVEWRPLMTATRDYDVYLYKVVEADSDPQAKVDIHYDGGTATQYLDHTSGSSGWVYLGRYPFAAGAEGYVSSTLNTDGKILRADAVRFDPVERPIIIDNGDIGYTEQGSWQNSGLTGYNGTGTRYSSTSLAQPHHATWQPDFQAAGEYTVSIYKIVHSASDPNARIDIVHSGGMETVYLDYTSGSSGWVELGTFAFDEGMDGWVRLWHQTEWKSARADAVRWVPAAAGAS
ncbi:family 16 glycosylhydrolase [Paenibacillus sp. 1P07SE]|uniref:golvesin C-terminal-like domain-containing protein n=1 Tax=Paenibacillus sp. 1P07SE TaxID=3132209 RepID=UPI0039A5F41B